MAESKAALARSLGIARSTLYYKPKRPVRDQWLRDQILEAWSHHPSYGHRRLAIHFKVNKKRILRVMRIYNLYPAVRRKRHKKRAFVPSTIPNRIKDVTIDRPNFVWVGDFTELWCAGHKVYLATVLDRFTREVIAWQIALHHTAQLVVDVLQEAVRKREQPPQYFHSDQGSEYASSLCIQWVVSHHILPSHSPKASPWRNGHQESFFGRFKDEFARPSIYPTVERLIEAIGKHIHYYNTERIHSALKMPPRQFFLEFQKSLKPKENMTP